MSATQPIRDKHQVNEIISYYKRTGNYRNSLLILICVHTALRIGDVLKISWGDVIDGNTGRVRRTIAIIEKKTGKSKIIALHKNVIAALEKFKRETQPSPGQPIFENKRTGKAISRVQAYRIIRAAAVAIGCEENVSCHSLRKTFGYHAWKSGVSPAVIMEIYNHSSFAVTRRYLGVAQDDKNKVYTGLTFAG